ncbi:DUF2927 domain-containing protein [Aquimarina sp. AU474]|uniref:DUF2927 domain-containing protein n=1 Tax=Aquimarina sp. AU474 TaxID=2108529 RepID=UPI0013598B3D|nr:DUF2927 domain-containing protein [Aquimarina sp. AU474]
MRPHHFKFLVYLFAVSLFISSCSSDDNSLPPEIENPNENGLTDYQLSVVTYFKAIALGFEFGNASKITRKWTSTMKIFVAGTPSAGLRTELDRIVSELNTLVSDGFKIEIVDDVNQSNFYMFFGTGDEYATLYPNQSSLVANNWGLFSIFWDGANALNTGHMYVDINRASDVEQKHLLREELTQSLGLARDSNTYQESIFQSAWTRTNEYATIDKDLIKLLYHPDMEIGLNATQVEALLIRILKTP